MLYLFGLLGVFLIAYIGYVVGYIRGFGKGLEKARKIAFGEE